MVGVDGELQAGIAIPATRAWMRIGTGESEVAVEPGDTDVSMIADLTRGPTTLQTWWIDMDGNRLAGAYYVTVRRV